MATWSGPVVLGRVAGPAYSCGLQQRPSRCNEGKSTTLTPRGLAAMLWKVRSNGKQRLHAAGARRGKRGAAMRSSGDRAGRPLGRRQAEVLGAIEAYVRRHDRPPTVRDLAPHAAITPTRPV